MKLTTASKVDVISCFEKANN